MSSLNRGGDSYRKVGGLIAQMHAAEGSAERRGVSMSPREARKNFIAIIFQLSGWALVAPSGLHCKLETPAPKKRGDIAIS